jgi:hypothetical protein
MLHQKSFCHVWLQQVCAEYRKEPTTAEEVAGSKSPVVVSIHDTSSCNNFQRKELAGGDFCTISCNQTRPLPGCCDLSKTCFREQDKLDAYTHALVRAHAHAHATARA